MAGNLLEMMEDELKNIRKMVQFNLNKQHDCGDLKEL